MHVNIKKCCHSHQHFFIKIVPTCFMAVPGIGRLIGPYYLVAYQVGPTMAIQGALPCYQVAIGSSNNATWYQE